MIRHNHRAIAGDSADAEDIKVLAPDAGSEFRPSADEPTNSAPQSLGCCE